MKLGLHDAGRRTRVTWQKAANRGSQSACRNHRAQIPVKMAPGFHHGQTGPKPHKELHNFHIFVSGQLCGSQTMRRQQAKHFISKVPDAGHHGLSVAMEAVLGLVELVHNFLRADFDQFEAHLFFGQIISIFVL
jgi:hypothetical protein